MSAAVPLAAVAGVCAAAAIADWVAAPRRPRGGPRRPTVGGRARLAGMTVLAARLARRVGGRAAPSDLDARIAAAGSPLGLGPGDIVALQGVGALVALLLAVPFATALPGRLGIAALLAAPLVGFLAPELALARLARRRGRRIADELADVLDLMRVAIGAGLPVSRAMGEVGRRANGLLAGELAAVAARIALGMPRAAALAALEARCPAPGVATLVAAIARAERHGAPLAPALEALAADARADQTRSLRDAAARAAPKIQLVVALLLVPSAMLLIGAVLLRGVGGG